MLTLSHQMSPSPAQHLKPLRQRPRPLARPIKKRLNLRQTETGRLQTKHPQQTSQTVIRIHTPPGRRALHITQNTLLLVKTQRMNTQPRLARKSRNTVRATLAHHESAKSKAQTRTSVKRRLPRPPAANTTPALRHQPPPQTRRSTAEPQPTPELPAWRLDSPPTAAL